MTKKALISVYDKTGLVDLAKKLQDQNMQMISTGKTYQYLKENGFNAMLLSDYTKFPEIMGGRVKTLHPKIHGGILANRNQHADQMLEHEIESIDLVVANLYPFQDYVKNNCEESDIIENIDIGGVTLLRAAAKNFLYVCCLSDPKDYSQYNTECDLDFRKKMAKKAFAKTAEYDAAIANWFCKEDEMPNNLNVATKKVFNFRYGENPHQKAAFYSAVNAPFKKLQGKELSYNNFLDIEAATSILKEFKNSPCCVIIKHNNPCGVAIDSSLELAYDAALSADSLSAFGGVIALNGKIEADFAKKLCQIFFEVIIADEITEDALNVFSAKKNLRILKWKEEKGQNINLKSALNGILVQQNDDTLNQNLEFVTKRKPTETELEQMHFANKVCKHVKSNAIVVAKDGKTFGIGAGQMSRIKSVQIAIEKANSQKNLVMASDAFFPFADSIEFAAKNGVTAILQPGGSLKDKEVIQKADELGIAMVFTKVRHFKH